MSSEAINNGAGLCDWGFIYFQGEGQESHVFAAPNLKTRVAGVESLDKAIEVAKSWADGGVQLIELCGWFHDQPGGTAAIIDAVGDRVAVGYVVPAPETDPLRAKIFGGG